MALVLADRVRETTTVTGTGTATLLGAVSGYQSFSAVGNANTTYYVIANQSASEWEVGIGTYTSSGTTLSRDTVLSSSNSGSLVNFTAGTKDVFVDYPASKAVFENASGNIDSYPITGGTIDNTVIGGTTPAAGTFTTLTATGTSYLGGAVGSEVVRVSSGTNTGKYTNFTSDSASNSQIVGATAGANLVLFSSSTNSIKLRTNGAAGSDQALVSHTASAVNYHQLTGSATGSGPIHSVAGSDTNIDLNLTTKGTGAVNLNTGTGTQVKIKDSGATTVNYLTLFGGGTGTGITYQPEGTDSNITLDFISKGTGVYRFATGSFSQRQFQISHTASAVNYVQVTGGSTGNAPYFISQGSDTNVNLWYGTKGSGYHAFFTAGNGANVQFLIANTASAVNYVQTSGSTTGFGAKIFSAGSDTNIPLVLQPKGTGALQAQQTDSTATGGNARGANAVDWQTTRSAASQVASNLGCVVGGGSGNTASSLYSAVTSGLGNVSNGFFNFVGGGFTNSGTASAAVTTQSATMNGTTAVTLAASNASIKVGQYITGTSIASDTYVSAISGTSLTLSKVASGSSTSTLSFYTPHGVVVGGGNNQATGSYSFIGGGGDAGTAANRNVASGAWSTVAGGARNSATANASFVGGGGTDGTNIYGNTASGTFSAVVGGANNSATAVGAFVGAGFGNTATGEYSSISGGVFGTTRAIVGNNAISACNQPVSGTTGSSQAALLILGTQTTDATATVLRSTTSAASTTNQVILPNNSAYTFRGEIVSGVTGGGNSKSWTIEGLIKRGANAASTTLVGSTVTSNFADAGASTWTIALTADTTNGGLAVTFTGQASTTIRTVCQIRTTEMTY